METIPKLLYKSSGLFKKDYAVVVRRKQILPGTFFEIDLRGNWKDFYTKEKVDTNMINGKEFMAIYVPKERLNCFLGEWTNTASNSIIVLAYFKEHIIGCTSNSVYTTTSDKLDIFAYIPKTLTSSNISVIQLDYNGRCLFNYDPINTIGVDLWQYEEINLGTIIVPGVKYVFHYGNENIKNRIMEYVKEKLREIKICWKV